MSDESRVFEVPRGHFRGVASRLQPVDDEVSIAVWTPETTTPAEAFGGATSAQVLYQHAERAQDWLSQRRAEHHRHLAWLQESLAALQSDLDAAQDEVDTRMQILAHRSEGSL